MKTKKVPMKPAKKGTFKRLFTFLVKSYKLRLIAVAVCIVFGAIGSVIVSAFVQQIVDKVITPGIQNGFESVADTLASIVSVMAGLYVIGILATYLQPRIMAVVTQGTLCKLRDAMFGKMQTLPIKYFDTHAHGDIMSTYTNDIDATRQLISQSIPSLFQSMLSIISIFAMMLYYSIWLTLTVIVVLIVMVVITKKIGGASAKYMLAQQKSLAREEGFIEEMLKGQKVVKVFCHEEESKADFIKYNEKLFKDGESAHRYGNILMPILHNVGNVMYVMVALIGALLVTLGATNICLTGVSPITAGVIILFLNTSRQLSQTVGQMSSQVSMIAMGLAGASRIFELIDQEPEHDAGQVKLVYAKKDADGNITESEKRTRLWAWKEPLADGTVRYTEVRGDIRME
ncbi:MAG: ABC transporter ATP-binding protein, partial [Firmicutes bacterium]|nr:ABC transporter ATP-binding protein [Bacillota bacterium]